MDEKLINFVDVPKIKAVGWLRVHFRIWNNLNSGWRGRAKGANQSSLGAKRTKGYPATSHIFTTAGRKTKRKIYTRR